MHLVIYGKQKHQGNHRLREHIQKHIIQTINISHGPKFGHSHFVQKLVHNLKINQTIVFLQTCKKKRKKIDEQETE